MTILPIPAFNDNYIWLIHEKNKAWVVDPGDAQPVIDAMVEHQLTLKGVLITHHHPDHVGGIPHLLETYPTLRVVGPTSDQIKLDRELVNEPDTIEVLSKTFAVIDIPGHTLDHIAYFCPDTKTPTLFCGDTLFAGGCGRIFEGTPEQMLNALNKLAALPANTQVFCAHEYTLANLDFSLAVEPDNEALAARLISAQATRKAQQPTVPSTIGLELATNPFLRSTEDAVIASAMNNGALSDSEIDVFSCIREWKNTY